MTLTSRYRRCLIALASLALLAGLVGQANAETTTLTDGPFSLSITDSQVGDRLTQFVFAAEIAGSEINSMVFGVDASGVSQLVPVIDGTTHPTLFNDSNALIPTAFPGRSEQEDTQFLFAADDVRAVLAAGGEDVTYENATTLAGLMAFPAGETFASRAIARVVLPSGATGSYDVQLGALDADGLPLGGRFGGTLTALLGPTPGDATADGWVDDNDLSLLLANWGSNVDWSHGEFSGVPPVDDNDLSLLLANWTGTGPKTLTVPEPAGLALLCLGGLSLFRRRR